MGDQTLSRFGYSEGEYGHRVRVYARPGRKNLYVEWWDSATRRMISRSLGHADEERGRTECRNLSDSLRLGSPPGVDPSSMAGSGDTLSSSPGPIASPVPAGPALHPSSGSQGPDSQFVGWRSLFRLHYRKVGRHKKGTGPAEDRRRAKIWVAYFRSVGIKTPFEIDEDDLKEFVRRRVAGEVHVPFVKLRAAVGTQTAWADLVFLVSVLNWATRAKDKNQPGRRVLGKHDLKVPPGLKNKNPRQPRMNHDDLLALRRAARSTDVDRQGLYRHFERLHDILGWRVSGMTNISAADVSMDPEPGMPYGSIAKNAMVDKEGCGDRIPLSLRGLVVVRRILRIGGIEPGGDQWLFPSPKDPSRPWSRSHVRDMMLRGERAAGLPHAGGSHSIRRKWASERKGHSTVDVMKAGGWSDERSLRSYMQDDAETTYEVVSHPTRRIRRLSPSRMNERKP